MAVEIRNLSTYDVESLIDIARDSWKWTYSGIYTIEFIEAWINEKYSKEKLIEEIKRSQSGSDIIFQGAFAETKMIGFIELKLWEGKAELLRLYLRPEYTHMGVGKLLLTEAEKILEKRGISQCRLYVHKLNSIGISFYKKNGFKISGTDGDDFIMEKIYT